MPVVAESATSAATNGAITFGLGTGVLVGVAQQLALGYVHNLSKRTALYGTLSHISNGGIATFAVPGGAAAPVAGKTSTGYELGIRHTF